MEGVDYDETFAPVVRYTSIRTVMAISMEMGWKIHQIHGCKTNLASEFEMKDIGLMHHFLGMEVWQEEGHVFLGQGKYVADILKGFQTEECRPMSTQMDTNWKKLDASRS